MAEQADVRIGDFLYKLAEGYYDQTGLRPMRRRWDSLFPGRQNVSGAPGVQNVRDDDLRWIADSFAAGEGQRVIDPSDSQTFRAFDRSQVIDFSNTGEMRLARQMSQQGNTATAPSTVEGNTWTDDVGTSTVVGTDRRLNVVGDAVKVNVALTAGQWQIDFYGYSDPATTIEGSTLTEEQKNTAVSGTDIRLKSEGATVRTANRTPAVGQVIVGARLLLDAPAKGGSHAKAKLIVWNQTADEKVAERHIELRANDGTQAVGTVQVSFKAKAGKSYRYKVVLVSLSKADYLAVDYLTEDEGDTRTLGWKVKNGAAVVASGSVDMTGITSTQRLASATVPITGTPTYTLRVDRTAGARKVYVDKALYQLATIADPRVIELGRSNLVWIVDQSAGAARVLYWDAAAVKWVSVGTIGAAVGKAVAMCHSDSYQFVALDDKIVYRVQEPSTAQQYTAAMGDAIEGLTVGGSRLLILTESTANGTVLYDCGLEGTPNITPTARYPVGNKGIAGTADVPQRMAATKNGCVFFANQATDCWIYEWDGSAGEPLAKMPPGFRGRAIAHANGLTYIGGGFPTVDPSGNASQRPAIFVVDHSTTATDELDVKFHRDEDPSTQIQDMQLFGTDLWVLTGVSSTPAKMRMWRVSLRQPIAVFLDQEITLDETQATGSARGLAITGQDTFAIWSKGSPYRRLTSYNVAAQATYTSSRYGFGLTEQKRLDAFDVVGIIPAGCSVQVSYEIDDSGTFVLVGSLTTPGRLVVSSPQSTVLFTTMRFQVRLISTDPAVTPEVYSVGVRGYSPTSEKRHELLLACLDQTSIWHIDGTQARGSEAIEYLYHLADTGALVEFENRYASKKSEESVISVVAIQNPDAFYLQRGEALVRVLLVERAA